MTGDRHPGGPATGWASGRPLKTKPTRVQRPESVFPPSPNLHSSEPLVCEVEGRREPESPLMSTILIAEDDQQIREALDRILRFEGYETVLANDGAAALEAFDTHEPDVALVDVMMPFVDGLSVVRKLRERGNRTPVLMLTARQETPDRVAGLDAGADDYLPKPFDLDELLARVRALLRRSGPSGGGSDLPRGFTTC